MSIFHFISVDGACDASLLGVPFNVHTAVAVGTPALQVTPRGLGTQSSALRLKVYAQQCPACTSCT